jgi:hypothetical protein
MRWLSLLASLAFVSAQSQALDVQRAIDQSSVAQQLSSPDARAQAWGAWIAGQYSMRELIPAILKVASPRLARTDRDSQLVLDVALDALIQLRAEVPPEFLQSAFPNRREQTLVLFSFAGAPANRVLLTILENEHGLAWYIAADVLLPRKPAGFASLLLRDVKFTVNVTLSKDGNISIGGGGLLGPTIGDGGSSVVPGFPPIAHYRITPYAAPGAVVVAIGPKPVYYERAVGPPGFTSAGSLDVSGPTAGELLAYIAALLDTDQRRLNLVATESHSVAWRDQASLDVEIEVIRTDIKRRYGSVIRQLREKKLLSDDEVARVSVPKIDVVIHDKRMF